MLAALPRPWEAPRRPRAGSGARPDGAAPASAAAKSPYAREAAERRPFVDTTSPVRPYVLTRARRRPGSPEQRAQAERRWALEMALRGIDVGPATIHGVHVRPGSRTLRVAVSA